MIALIRLLRDSLEQLTLGLTGALNITEQMEALFQALSLNQVPAVWATRAYHSNKHLAGWFKDLT